MAVSESTIERTHPLRPALFLFAFLLVLAAWFVGRQAFQTIMVLDQVEHERDRWQQPREIIEPLHLQDGSVVADVGSGAGYFTLKLAPMVGAQGAVFAVDIRREPLAFLWIRTLLRHQSNVHVIHAEPDNPHLPPGRIDAVLIANTYHEFTSPRVVLAHVLQSLHSGGRLVIADRGPLAVDEQSRASEALHHELDPSAVESDLRETGFDVIDWQDRFIDQPAVERPGDRPDNHPWWLIVARKP